MSQVYNWKNNNAVNSSCFEIVNSKLNSLEIWDLVKAKIVNIYGEGVFRSWFKAVNFSHYDQGIIFLNAPSKFIRDWINNNYGDFVLKSWQEYDKKILLIEFLICENIKDNFANITANMSLPINQNELLGFQEKIHTNNNATAANQVSDNNTTTEQIPQQTKILCFNTRLTFENFVIGKSNELAYFAAKRIAESNCAIAGNNPLFLYGGVGLGKTHLMHSIANHKIEQLKKEYPKNWLEKAKQKIIYIPSERFIQEFIASIGSNDMKNFKNRFRSADLLMIDDVQFLSGKDYTQEEFFHTFNALMDEGKQLVISADRTPGCLNGIEERIRSRLGWGLIADIGSTCYELRMGILKKKSENLSIKIEEEVLQYLAQNIQTNVRELEGALNTIIANNSLTKSPISLLNVKQILADMVSSNQERHEINISHIQKKVCDFYQLNLSELLSQNRSRNLARPRQIAMYLCKKLTCSSLSEIAKQFGGKDHSTVIHNINKVESLAKSDQEISKQINQISISLKK